MARTTTPRSSAGHRLARRLQQRGTDQGFTLAESVVALTLFVIVSVSTAWGITQTIQLTNVTSRRVGAANIATQELERLRMEKNTGHGLLLDPPPSEVPAPYTVSNSAGSCSAGVLPVTIRVGWGDPSRSVVYDSELQC